MFTYRVDEDVTLELESVWQAPAIYRLISRNRGHLKTYMPWVDLVHSEADTMHLIQRSLRGMAAGERWAWLLRYRGHATGQIVLSMTNPNHHEAELSYWLAAAYTKRGIVTRGIRAVIDYAFSVLQLHRLRIEVDSDNVRSRAVPERLGFSHDLTLRDDVLHAGKFRTLCVYGLLRDEWHITQKPRFALHVSDAITLQLMQHHHVEAAYAIIETNRENLIPYLSWAKTHTPHTQKRFLRYVLQAYAEGASVTAGIWLGESLTGQIALSIDVDHHHAEVGYWLDAAYRGRGIMSQALERLLQWGFGVRQLNRIWLRVAPDNPASIGVALRANMRYEGTLRADQRINGAYVSHRVYSILMDEWLALTN